MSANSIRRIEADAIDEAGRIDVAASADVVAMLRAALARAEAGGVAGVAITLLHDDGEVGTSWSTGKRWIELLGGVTLLQHRMAAP